MAPDPDWHSHPAPDPLIERVWPRSPDGAVVRRDQLPLRFLRGLRLFGVACARTVWDLLPTDARSAVLLSERFADGTATEADVRAAAVRLVRGARTPEEMARNAAGWASVGHFGPPGPLGAGFRSHPDPPTPRLRWEPVDAAREAAKALATRQVGPANSIRPALDAWLVDWNTAFFTARAVQANILRDIFPPPDQAITLDPRWLTSAVRELALAMDTTGDFSAVPILADALQDAGCADDAVLARCRHPGPHVRGNWVVDLILNRL